MNCPPGYYEKNGKCVKGIVIKRSGIYGQGFESLPQNQQYAKIRQEESVEGPNVVLHQMAALNAFSHNKGPAHKDMEYAKRIGREKRLNSGKEHNCPQGYEWVSSHNRRTGTRVNGYCREVK
jgi:hypothetical protein